MTRPASWRISLRRETVLVLVLVALWRVYVDVIAVWLGLGWTGAGGTCELICLGWTGTGAGARAVLVGVHVFCFVFTFSYLGDVIVVGPGEFSRLVPQ